MLSVQGRWKGHQRGRKKKKQGKTEVERATQQKIVEIIIQYSGQEEDDSKWKIKIR